MNVDDAPDIRPHGVDGSVGTKPQRVYAQEGGALVHHITNHIHFHLERYEPRGYYGNTESVGLNHSSKLTRPITIL